MPVAVERSRPPAEVRAPADAVQAEKFLTEARARTRGCGRGRRSLSSRRCAPMPALGNTRSRSKAAGSRWSSTANGAALAGIHHPRVQHPRPEAVPAPAGEHPRRVVPGTAVRAVQRPRLPGQSWSLVRLVRRHPPDRAAPDASGAIGIDWGVTADATATDPAYDLPYWGTGNGAPPNWPKPSGAWPGGAGRAGRPSRRYRRAAGSRRIHKKAARQNTHAARLWASRSLTTTRRSRWRTSSRSSWPGPPWPAKPRTRRSVRRSGN